MRRHAFTLIELVMVAAIIVIIAMIAAPRMSNALENSAITALRADTVTVQKAADLYAVEHYGLTPAHDASGSVDLNGNRFMARLLLKTDDSGRPGQPGSIFGPYLRSFPTNPRNNLNTVRIDGAPAGAGTHGWRFGTARAIFLPDNGNGIAEVGGP